MSDSPVRSRRGLIQVNPHGASLRRQTLEHSITMTPNELQRLIDQDQLNNSSFLGQSMNASGMASASLFAGGDNVSMSGRSMLLDDMQSEQGQMQNAFTAKADMLFPQFLEVLQGRTNDVEVFDTVQDLIQTCAGILDEKLNEVARGPLSNDPTAAWLDQELKTWKLLYALYKDRIMIQGEAGDIEVSPLGGSEKEVIAQLYANNSTLREYQLIVDWLEACYDPSGTGQVGHSSDRTAGWENTLFQLQHDRQVAFGNGTELVKHLDPDAPVREKRPLHSLDEEDNQRLSRCIFTEIRQGHIEEAMALCKYCGQTWRAAILEGWRLHEDPNYETPSAAAGEKLPIEGNPRRDMWKKCAWMMADSKKYDEYTRAIAGAFCGHLDSLKGLLTDSWEDLLWAYLKVQIDIRVESEIRACCIKTYLPMPEEYWNSKMSMEQIFNELAVHKDAAVRDYAVSRVGVIQKFLILDNVTELLLQMHRWVDEAVKPEGGIDTSVISPHMLRFLTHIVLFMRQIGRIVLEESADRIIEAYVECLIEMQDTQLVAFYTAALPSAMQIRLYSKFLQGIQETEARSVALNEALNCGLDVESITRHTVNTVRQQMPPSESPYHRHKRGKLQVGEISAFDRMRIRALEWLTFLPAQRGELLWQTNAMIRNFIAEGQPECVRAAYDMVPVDSLSHILNVYGSKENFPCREECSIKEYLGYKVYLAAIDSFDEWSHLYYNRPKEPQLPDAATANFTERMASEHKEQLYRSELQRWTMSLEEQSKVTSDALFNILLFPDKGWLIDPDTPKDPTQVSATEWENRQIQLNKLRSICIPEIVLLLHKVLHTTGDHKGCIKLADEIASESRMLYKVYTKHKLAELLAKISETSLELLNSKLDPFGYPAAV